MLTGTFIPFGIWARTLATILGFQENLGKWQPSLLNSLRAARLQGLRPVSYAKTMDPHMHILTKWAKQTKSNPELQCTLWGTFNLKLVFVRITLEDRGPKIKQNEW